MRCVTFLLALLSFALASCATERVQLEFPTAETKVGAAAEGEPQLHGVATTFGGQIPVFVGPSAKPQVLSLMSNDLAVWHVYILPGANLTEVYVSGFDPQQLVIEQPRGAPTAPEPRIVSTGLQGHGILSFGPPMRLDGKRGEAYRTELKSQTGLELTGFVGHQQFWPGEAVAVGMSKPPGDALVAKHFPQALSRNIAAAEDDLETVRADLAALVERGKLPARMPMVSDDGGLPAASVKYWDLLPDNDPRRRVPANRDCGRVQLGTAGDDALWCANSMRDYEAETLWVIAGAGRDILSDDWRELSQVLSGGDGDDIINSDLGNDVMYFGPNWGKDVVSFRCFAHVDDFNGRSPPEPKYQNSSHVVFGSGVFPKNLRWISSNEIEDRSTGSRIRFDDEPCTNFLAVEHGKVPLPSRGD